MASGLYNLARRSFIQGAIDWENDNIDVLLVQNTYTFDATDGVVSDVVATELSATDYVRKDLAGRTVTNAATTEAKASNVVWTALGNGTNQTIGGAVVFVNSGADGSSAIICFLDTADIATQDTDVTLQFAGGTVFTWVNS